MYLICTHTHIYNYTLFPSSAEDQQFNDEKQYLIKQIREMQPTAVATAADGAAV